MTDCISCGAALKAGAKFCGKCGVAQESSIANAIKEPLKATTLNDGGVLEPSATNGKGDRCPNCGKATKARRGAKFCGACGHRFAVSMDAPPFDAVKPATDRKVPQQDSAALRSGVGQSITIAKNSRTSFNFTLVTVALLCAGIGAGYWLAARPTPPAGPGLDQPSKRVDGQVADNASQRTPKPSQEPAETPTAKAIGSGEPVEASSQPRDQVDSGNRVRTARRGDKSKPAPSPPIVTKSTPAPPLEQSAAQPVQPPAPVEREAALPAPRTIDQVYEQRAAVECRSGFAGFLCRERVRFNLCEGKWTGNEVPGMTLCRVVGHAAPPS